MSDELRTDPKRIGVSGETGIFVRAKDEGGKWGSFDIAELDRASLWVWLHSREDIKWPANVVLLLLGHEQVTEANRIGGAV